MIVVDLLNREHPCPISLATASVPWSAVKQGNIFQSKKRGRTHATHINSASDSANDGLGLNPDIHRENLGSRVTWEIPESKTQFGIDKAAWLPRVEKDSAEISSSATDMPKLALQCSPGSPATRATTCTTADLRLLAQSAQALVRAEIGGTQH